MNRIARRTLAASLAALTLPSAALAQGGNYPAPPKRVEVQDNRPPIPPGVPTTADNVYLPTEGEVRVGRDGAADVEKHYKLITSGPYYERLQRVSREVVKAIQRPEIINEYRKVYHLPRRDDKSKRVPFEYSFKVLDTTREINAFSLAGGPVYVTRGLLDTTTSDDELAAVLAHECSHVAFHHIEQMVRKQKKAQTAQIWTLLAAVLAGAAGGGAAAAAAGNVALGGQLVSIATMTGFSRELETEADRVGVMALNGSRYNPAAMLTFMQKLENEVRLHANPDYGIYMDHPYTNERVDAIRKQLVALGVRVDQGYLRTVSGRFKLQTTPQRMNGKDVVELRLNGNLMMVLAASDGGLTPVDRGERISRELGTLFGENITFNDVRLLDDGSGVNVRGVPVIRVLPEDAAASGSTPADVSRKAYNEIVKQLLSEKLSLPR